MRRAPSPQTLNLLLAEDNLPDALVVREAITAEGLPLEVHVVADGEKAVDFIARAEQDPDAPCPHILVLDLNLPRIDGFEVLRRLRASDKCKHVRSEAARLGAAFFRKPVTYDEFLKIGAFLRRFLQDNGLI